MILLFLAAIIALFVIAAAMLFAAFRKPPGAAGDTNKPVRRSDVTVIHNDDWGIRDWYD